MKRVLVTGASGFVGRQALPILQEKGFDVHAVSLRESLAPSEGVMWHHGDLLDGATRRELIDIVRPTHVLHFAWIATPGVYWTSPLNDAWREATIDLLALCKEFNVERFVGAGSSAEYDWSGGHCDEEETPLLAATPYGKAKVECGQQVMAASDSDLTTAWGRIFFLYGPYEHPSRFVPSVILSLLRGERARCTHGKQIRDFLHVADVASAFVALLESDVTRAVNIASGLPVTICDVASTIGHQLGRPDAIDFGAIASPASDPPCLTASVERLQREVRWQPSLNLEAGIADTIEWWKNGG